MHLVMKLHCIIHQENICAKISNSALHDVISTVTKIVSFLVAHSATTHGQFRSLLKKMERGHHDVLLHCSVGWFSGGKVILTFVKCLVEIRTFLIGPGKANPELEDEKRLVKLMFFADVTTHFNELYLCLQGRGQTVMCVFEVWKGFVSKLDVYMQDIQTATFCILDI